MGTVGNFFPTIVSSLGYNSTITLLLTAPPYSETLDCDDISLMGSIGLLRLLRHVVVL